MRNILILILTSLNAIGFSQNQIVTDSMPSTFEQHVATIFEHVDLSEITNGNGLLYEHGFPFYNCNYFWKIKNKTVNCC